VATPTPTFSWNSVAGATGYELWVKNNTAGQNQVIDQVVSGTSFTPPQPLPHAQYSAWVRAFAGASPTAGSSNVSQWSVPWNFAVVSLLTPQLLGPSGIITTTQPMFTWTVSTGADHYEFFLSDLTTGQNQYDHQTHLSATTYAPLAHLSPGTYEVWVRALGV